MRSHPKPAHVVYEVTRSPGTITYTITYCCNTSHHLFFWLTSTSILKGLQPRCYFDSFQEEPPKKKKTQNHNNKTHTYKKTPKHQQKTNRKERRTITHLTSLPPKHTFTTQSPISALTRLCSYTPLEYCSEEMVMIYLTELHFYTGAVLFLFLKKRVCCLNSQRLSQINTMMS